MFLSLAYARVLETPLVQKNVVVVVVNASPHSEMRFCSATVPFSCCQLISITVRWCILVIRNATVSTHTSTGFTLKSRAHHGLGDETLSY